MDFTAIKLPVPGKWDKDFYDICNSVMNVKGVKNVTHEIILISVNCINKIIELDTEQADKLYNNFKNYVNGLSNYIVLKFYNMDYPYNDGNNDDNSDNSKKKHNRDSITPFIPKYYVESILYYSKIYTLKNKLFILPNGQTELKYKQAITSKDDLIKTFTTICNIILPIAKRKKIDCFHIQAVIKMILCNNYEYEINLVNTINSFARIMTKESALANTVKTDPLIKSTVDKFKIGLTEGLSLTNEASIYLTLFVESFSNKIENLDSLIKIGNAKKEKKVK